MKETARDKKIKAMAKPSGWTKVIKIKEKCYCGLPMWHLIGKDGTGPLACEEVLTGKNV
jgi:hypothetical protein